MEFPPSLQKCALKVKRSKHFFLFGVLCSLLSTLVVKELHPPIPSKKTPAVFYSNQSWHNLKRVYSHAINSAKTSLFLKIYALSDKTLLDLITKKGKTLPTQIFYDPSASPTLEQTSPHIK